MACVWRELPSRSASMREPAENPPKTRDGIWHEGWLLRLERQSSARTHSMAHHIAFEREALPFLGALQHFAQQLCGDEQYAHDLVQETMLKALRSFHTYREGTNCRAWLFQICKNSFINAYRRKQYETIAVDFEEEPASFREGRIDDVGRTPHPIAVDEKSSEFQRGALGDEVAAALESIPTEYQTVLILSDIEGFTYEEIASLVHAPIGTVRSRIHRGRKQLAHRLTAYAHRNGCSIKRFPT